MFFLKVDRVTRSLLAASIFTLAACSSPNGNAGITPAAAQPASVFHAPFGTSPKAQLYISDDGTNEVETFTWPKPKSAITLTGFSEPQGECADQSGNVFITNTGNSNILEYALGGTDPIDTLSDAHEYPVGCSFDRTNGDLAVSNILSTADGNGNVAIYKNAKGAPKIVTPAGVQRVFFVQYDGSRDLFVSGDNSSYEPVLAEMPAGSKQFKVVCPNLFGSQFPGGLGWDGKYIVIGVPGGLERIRNCKVVGFTPLGDSDEFYISGNRVVVPDAGSAEVYIYGYPKGGEPIQTLTGFGEPIGAVVGEKAK
jgi:hypothetical protein